MLNKERIEKYTKGGKFFVAWKRIDGSLAFYSGKMSDLPARGKLADDRFLLDTSDDDTSVIKTVIIPNIIFVANAEGGPVLENMPLDIEDAA